MAGPRGASLAADGSERELRTRTLGFDPLSQTVRSEIWAEKWLDGEHVASEVHAISMRLYFHHELLLMLEGAGFTVEASYGDFSAEPPSADSNFIAYAAKRR